MRHSLARFFLLPLVVSTILLFASCGKDEDTNPASAPELPPVSSMVMDFSDFQQGGASLAASVPGSRQNWGWAALNVAVWNTVIAVTLAVPVASFVEAFNHDPEPQSDGSWLWTYSFTAAGASYTAKLYGRVDLNGTSWDMFVTKAGQYTDFHWYTGRSNLALTDGTWSLNQSPESPTPFLDILWHRNPADSTGDLTYVNVVPAHPDSSGYITYGLTRDVPYNAFYDIFSPSRANMVEIEWNRPGHEGRIRDPLHFGDGSWHCWDSNLEDADCP